MESVGQAISRAISRALDATEPLRDGLVEKAVAGYFAQLSETQYPPSHKLSNAVARAQTILIQETTSSTWLEAIAGESLSEESRSAPVDLDMDAAADLLRVPAPAKTMRPRPLGVIVPAVVGSIGALILLRLATGMTLEVRDFFLTLVASLGAAGLVLLVLWAPRTDWTPGGLLDVLRHPLRSLRRGVFRVLPRCLHGVLRYDRKSHESAVRQAIAQWLEAAVCLQATVAVLQRGPPPVNREAVLGRLGRYVQRLSRASKDDLLLAAEELIQEARSVGFEGLPDEPVFVRDSAPIKPEIVWRENLRERYETFGHIEDGDRVSVEEEPVILNGKMLKKGLVRKVRNRG